MIPKIEFFKNILQFAIGIPLMLFVSFQVHFVPGVLCLFIPRGFLHYVFPAAILSPDTLNLMTKTDESGMSQIDQEKTISISCLIVVIIWSAYETMK